MGVGEGGILRRSVGRRLLLDGHSQVGGLGHGVFEHFRASAFEHELSGLENVGVVGDEQAVVHVLLDEQDREAEIPQLLDHLEDLLDDDRREAK